MVDRAGNTIAAQEGYVSFSFDCCAPAFMGMSPDAKLYKFPDTLDLTFTEAMYADTLTYPTLP